MLLGFVFEVTIESYSHFILGQRNLDITDGRWHRWLPAGFIIIMSTRRNLSCAYACVILLTRKC